MLSGPRPWTKRAGPPLSRGRGWGAARPQAVRLQAHLSQAWPRETPRWATAGSRGGCQAGPVALTWGSRSLHLGDTVGAEEIVPGLWVRHAATEHQTARKWGPRLGGVSSHQLRSGSHWQEGCRLGPGPSWTSCSRGSHTPGSPHPILSGADLALLCPLGREWTWDRPRPHEAGARLGASWAQKPQPPKTPPPIRRGATAATAAAGRVRDPWTG